MLINVAEFLYVEGSMAIDLGSRETVIINTGIPASLGSLIPQGTIDTINTTLSDLSTTLTSMQTQIATQLDSALGTLRDSIDNPEEANVKLAVGAPFGCLGATTKATLAMAPPLSVTVRVSVKVPACAYG